MTPQGGTEIQHRFLEHYVDEDLLKHFQICTSIPGKVPIDPNKLNILWQKKFIRSIKSTPMVCRS